MEIFIIIGLILLNGLLSMSEIALVSARKARLELEAKRGNKSAKTALKLAQKSGFWLPDNQRLFCRWYDADGKLRRPCHCQYLHGKQ